MSAKRNNRLFSLLAFCALAGCDRAADPSAARGTPAAEPTAAVVAAADDYVPGTLIEFKAGGNSVPYLVSGWSHTEADFTWTEGQSAVLSFNLPRNVGPLVLKMKLAGLINPPELLSQRVEIYVNQQKLVEWEVGETAELQADVPAELTKAGALTVELKMPQAASPKAVGKSEDNRVLGVCVYNLVLAKP